MDQQIQIEVFTPKVEGTQKKTYHAPILSEYGDVATATQNMASGAKADAGGKLMGM